MSISPRVNFVDLVAGQAVPETTVNEMARRLEQGAGHFIFLDRNENDPPGSPADGDCYLVAASATGAWTGHEDEIAFYMNTAWEFIEVIEGFSAWVADENALIVATAPTAWTTIAASGGAASINAQSGTSYTLVLGDAENVVELTNGSAITLTIPTNASVAFPVGTVVELHQGGAGVVTVAAAGGVTLLSRGSLVDLAGEEAIAAVRKVATNTWRLTGDIA